MICVRALQLSVCLLVAQMAFGEQPRHVEEGVASPKTVPAVTVSIGNDRPMPYTEFGWDSKHHGSLHVVAVKGGGGVPASILASGDGTRIVIRGAARIDLRDGALNITPTAETSARSNPPATTRPTTQPALDGGVPMSHMRTRHYQIAMQGNAIAPGELAVTLEPLYAQLKAFFGTEPHQAEPLRLMIFESYRDYAKFIRSVAAAGDGNLDGPNQGREPVEPTGTYLQWTRTAVVVGGLGPCRTRDSIIRQCFAQFLYLAKDLNFAPSSDYYTSGLAQYFALHSWDGRWARFATIPDVYWFDVPAEAKVMFDQPPYKHSLRALATSSTKVSRLPQDGVRACGWGLVSFLLDKCPKEFGIWSDAIEHMVDPVTAWDKAFSSASDRALSDNYAEWLAKHQMLWCGLSGDWQNTDPHTFEGYETPGFPFWVAACATASPCTQITAQAELGQSASPGVVICCRASDEFTTVCVSPTGEVWLTRRFKLTWYARKLVGRINPPGLGKITLSAKWADNNVSVSVNGKTVYTQTDPLKGGLGIAVSDGGVTFTDVQAR